MTDALNKAVDAAAAAPLGRLLRGCAAASSSSGGGGDSSGSGGGGGGDGEGAQGGDALSINVLAAVAQLAREEGAMLEDATSEDGGPAGRARVRAG
jgi:hypothetical protein